MPSQPDVRLFGRDEAMAVLRDLLIDLMSARGSFVWVEGEPGVGRSALIDVGLSEITSPDIRIFRSTARSGTDSPRLQLLADCLSVYQSHDELRSEIADLLSGDGGASSRASAAGELMLTLVDQECARSPVALAIDDLQWVDDESLGILHKLADKANSLPLLMMGTCRPLPRRTTVDRLRRTVHEHARGVMLELAGLSLDAVAAIAEARLSGTVGERLREALGQAGGNPSFALTMLDQLAADGLLLIGNGSAELAAPLPSELPSLDTAIGRRLEFLPAQTRKVLRAAAVLGHRFRLMDLALALDQRMPDLARAVQEAVVAGILTNDGADLVFRHPVVQRALENEMPAAARAGLRAATARELAEAGAPLDRVARYLLAAPGELDDWGLAWLANLPTSALNASPAAAADLLWIARNKIAPTDPSRDRFIARLTTVLRLTHRYEDLAGLASEIRDVPIATQLAGEIACNVGLGLHSVGRTDEAASMIGQVLEGQDGLWRRRAGAIHAMVLSTTEGSDRARAEAGLAFSDGQRDGDALAMAWSLETLLRTAGNQDALAYLDQAIAGLVGDDPETTDILLDLHAARLSCLSGLHRADQFEADLARVAAFAERTSSRRRGLVEAVASHHLYQRGDWTQALVRAELAIATGDPPALHEAHAVAARIAARRDNHSLARQHLAAASEWGGPRFSRRGLRPVRALLAEASGEPDAAAGLLAEHLDATEREFSDDRHECLPNLVRLAVLTDSHSWVQAAVDTACQDAEQWPNSPARLTAQVCQAMAKDDPASLLSAAEQFDQVGRRSELAFALEEAAVRLAYHGDTSSARSAFSRATTIYADVQASNDIRRIQDRLRPYAIRRARAASTPATGWDALTVAERAVAKRVIRGESNQTIAAELFVSRRTVESHVSKILTKLNVRSRTAIAHAAALRDAVSTDD